MENDFLADSKVGELFIQMASLVGELFDFVAVDFFSPTIIMIITIAMSGVLAQGVCRQIT